MDYEKLSDIELAEELIKILKEHNRRKPPATHETIRKSFKDYII